MRKHLVSLNDLSDSDISNIVSRGVEFSSGKSYPEQLLKGKVVGIYFRKTSTRTRTAFSSAALRLGAQIISYGPNDLQENTGESISDTTKVLSRMLDCFVARTSGDEGEMRTFASQSKMAVVNAMSANEHPTQALTDLTSMMQHFGDLKGLRVLYIGEGNNTAVALALSLPRFPHTELFLCTPPGYGVPEETFLLSQQYAERTGSKVTQFSGLENLPSEVDIVYTTRWETTGTVKPDQDWKNKFLPYSVSQELMEKYSSSIFMHDLPAHRGEEVEASVIDSSRSIVFDQAENKLNSAKAVLEWCLSED